MNDQERRLLESGLTFTVVWATHWRVCEAYGCGQPEFHPEHQKVIDEMCEVLGKPRITANGELRVGRGRAG